LKSSSSSQKPAFTSAAVSSCATKSPRMPFVEYTANLTRSASSCVCGTPGKYTSRTWIAPP
jgi:hypothetical protein